jgi:hypothetical protein
MRSHKKLKALSVLSLAAAATLAANSAHGAVLSVYYDNINDVTDGQSYSYASTARNYAAIPTTINIAVGDTFQFGVDVVVTNNVNPDAGKETGTSGHTAVQPSYLGLSTLAIVVPSTDNNASKLAPNTNGDNGNTFSGRTDYNSTASLNNTSGLGTSVAPNNNPGGFIPVWAVNLEGDIVPGSSTAGDVGDHFQIFQGNGATPSNTIIGTNTIAEYGAATATFGNATDFFDSLSYIALHTGTVTLSPNVFITGSSYWANTRPGSSTVVSGYRASTFTNPGDVIGTLPVLVINITGEPPIHSIISLTAASDGVPTTYGASQGTLTVTGNEGNYNLAQLTGLSATTGFVEANGFYPALDEEIYALDVLVNGVQANAAQIGVLLNAINGTDGVAPPPPGLVAAATYAGLDVTHDASPFPSQYNLFVDSGFPPSSDNFLSFDLSNADDSNLVGYSVSAIAVVPEPMSLSLLTAGTLGLFAMRPRRPTCNRNVISTA